jgi:hypothetical protein
MEINARYLRTKREKLGHLLDDDGGAGDAAGRQPAEGLPAGAGS